METSLVESLITSGDSTGLLEAKQQAERDYEKARADVDRASSALDAARATLSEARNARTEARREWDEMMRSSRKPRQKNIVRRILAEVSEPKNRRQIIDATELDPTTVSTTLTRLRKAGFVSRVGDGFTGNWTITPEGRAFMESDAPMPKQ
jgi:predicted transcriptional regulator